MKIGSDIGGTFTDLINDEGQAVKVLSRKDDPYLALREGVSRYGDSPVSDVSDFYHGTTLGTNAVLERRGSILGLITTEGLRDVVEIARQDRPSLYDPFADRPEALVGRRHRFEVEGRLDAKGREIKPLNLKSLDLQAIPKSVKSLAVCLLHSDLNPKHEKLVERHFARQGYDVTCSYKVAPEFREYERTSTTVLNAYLRKIHKTYLGNLSNISKRVFVLTSAGGLISAKEAAEFPVKLLLSGPAGGVRAGAHYAAANGFADAVTLDMGGTSTDVCLISDGKPDLDSEHHIEGFPARVPSLAVETIGAGGGSIAWLDRGGALQVGPQSAGGTPGPACYGRGGTLPTVTDANLLLNRISRAHSFPDLGKLDAKAAKRAFAKAGITPKGVVDVVNINMTQALRRVTLEKGVDARSLALVAFGGAGPLHACDLAEGMNIKTVIVPPRAGVLSAVGIYGSPRQADFVSSWPEPLKHKGLEKAMADISRRAGKSLPKTDEVKTSLDCCYKGQSFELNVPKLEDFHKAHKTRNGYSRTDDPVEVRAIRASAFMHSSQPDFPVEKRQTAKGPAVVSEQDSTVWIPPGWKSQMGEMGCLVLKRTGK